MTGWVIFFAVVIGAIALGKWPDNRDARAEAIYETSIDTGIGGDPAGGV